jgi:hypothetical protein
MFSVITNIYNKKAEGPTLMELFTTTRKLKKFFFMTRDFRCVPCHPWCTHRTFLDVKKKKKLFHFSCGCEHLH